MKLLVKVQWLVNRRTNLCKKLLLALFWEAKQVLSHGLSGSHTFSRYIDETKKCLLCSEIYRIDCVST